MSDLIFVSCTSTGERCLSLSLSLSSQKTVRIHFQAGDAVLFFICGRKGVRIFKPQAFTFHVAVQQTTLVVPKKCLAEIYCNRLRSEQIISVMIQILHCTFCTLDYEALIIHTLFFIQTKYTIACLALSVRNFLAQRHTLCIFRLP